MQIVKRSRKKKIHTRLIIPKITVNDLEAIEILLTYTLNNECFQFFCSTLNFAGSVLGSEGLYGSPMYHPSSEDSYNFMRDTDNRHAYQTGWIRATVWNITGTLINI